MNTASPLYNGPAVVILSEGFGRGAGDERPMARVILLVLAMGLWPEPLLILGEEAAANLMESGGSS